VVKVAPLTPHVLMCALEQVHGLATAMAALRATRDPPLGFGKPFLRLAVVSRVRHHLTVGGDQEPLQPDIDPPLIAGGRQRLGGHVGTRETGIPAVRLTAQRDGRDGALDGTRPAHGDASDLGQDQSASSEPSTVAVLLVGKGVRAVATLETWGKPGVPQFMSRQKNAWYVVSRRTSTSCKTCEWIAA
jgi:hypothetical protein